MKVLFLAFLMLANNQGHPSVWKKNLVAKINTASSLECEHYPKIDDLQHKFDCESALLNVSNALYRGWLKANKLDREGALFALWEKGNNQNKPTNRILSNPIVRLNLAALIGQLKRVKQRDFSLKAQRNYARSFIDSQNTLYLIDAITAIGWTGTYEDAHSLISIIKQEDEGVAEHAVLSLINLLGSDYKAVLLEVNASIKREALHNFIKGKLCSQYPEKGLRYITH